MKLRCNFCKIEKELTKEQVEYITKLIETNPNAKAYDYIEIATVMSESNCIGDDRHSFQFSEDFSKTIDESVTNVKASQEKIDGINNKEKELKTKSKSAYDEYIKTSRELADLTENKNVLSDELLSSRNIFKEISGSDKIELWS